MKKCIDIIISALIAVLIISCSSCIIVLADEQPPTDITENAECNHIWDEGKIIKTPTCKNTGLITHYCTICGEPNNETIPKATNHSYKTVIKKATVKANGKVNSTCAVCGKVQASTTIYYPKTITLSATNYTYDGKVKRPIVTVKDSKDKVISAKNYTISYDKGRKNVGKYAVKITFKGNYSGTATRYFKINPKISLSATSYTYDGKVKKPSVTVKTGKNNNFSSKYYTVSYSKGRKAVGKYKVVIKFRNGHSGTYTKTFTIKPRNTRITSLSAKPGTFTVKWNKQTNQVSGYQIRYSGDSKFKSNEIITMPKNTYTGKTVSGLDKKTYYVSIRTYKTVKFNDKNIKIYSPWSKGKSVYVKTGTPAKPLTPAKPGSKDYISTENIQKQVNDYIKSRNGYCGFNIIFDPTLNPKNSGWSGQIANFNDKKTLEICLSAVDMEIEDIRRCNPNMKDLSLYCFYDEKEKDFYICYMMWCS